MDDGRERRGEGPRLVGRMAGAHTEEEIGGAERAADRYLCQHPNDLDVLVAREGLARRAAKARDPERGANRWGVVAFVVLAVGVALVLWWYVGMAWAVAAGSGVLVAGEVGECVWHALRDEGRDRGRGRDG